MTEDNLTERVTSDPALNAAEKETTIAMCGDEKEFQIFSAKATVVKSLLKHDHFDADWVGGEKDACYQKREDGHADDLDAIYSISGTLPVGVLTVKSSPRSNNHQSSIVNSEKIDPDAFS